jgi:hypothetical protein
MKQVTGFIFVISLFVIACSSMDTKKMACQQACDTSLEECKKKAGKSKTKIAACEAAHTQCMSDCDQ